MPPPRLAYSTILLATRATATVIIPQWLSLLNRRTLLPLNPDTVLIGCVGQNCSRTGQTRFEPTRHSGEEALRRTYDMHVSFVQPMHAYNKMQDDPLRLHHYSWQICHNDMDPATCRWRDVANGHYDQALLVPAAKHIMANLTNPIVLAICNEMNSKVFAGACGSNVSRYSLACAKDYKDMYHHIRAVFEREGINSDPENPDVVWSWQTFNMCVID